MRTQIRRARGDSVKRYALLTLLTVTIGFPSAVGVTEVCANKFDQEWAKKVLSYTKWNRTHQNYVKAHNLTRDMHKERAALRSRMLKKFDFACGVENGSESESSVGSGPNIIGLLSDQPAFVLGRMEAPYVDSVVEPLLAKEPYPVYESPNRSLPDVYDAPGAGLGGWFGGGGYLGSNPSSPSTPTVPIVATPELSTFSLVAFGAALLITRRTRRQ